MSGTPSTSMMMKPATMARKTNIPSRVSNESFMRNPSFSVVDVKIRVQKSLDQRIGIFPDLIRRPQGGDAALVNEADVVSHAEGQVAIVRDDHGSDLDFLFQVQNFLADDQ